MTRCRTRRGATRTHTFDVSILSSSADPFGGHYYSLQNLVRALAKYYAAVEGTAYFEKKPDHFTWQSLLLFLVHEPHGHGTPGSAPYDRDCSWRDDIDQEIARRQRVHSVARD